MQLRRTCVFALVATSQNGEDTQVHAYAEREKASPTLPSERDFSSVEINRKPTRGASYKVVHLDAYAFLTATHAVSATS